MYPPSVSPTPVQHITDLATTGTNLYPFFAVLGIALALAALIGIAIFYKRGNI